MKSPKSRIPNPVKSGILKPVNAKKPFIEKQLAKGTKTGMEHTTHKGVAKTIAKHHLKEIPDYYTRLDKMEKGAKLGKISTKSKKIK